jgi:hypothetical protein
MDAPVPGFCFATYQLDDHGKAEPSGNDGGADRDDDPGVFGEADEVVAVEGEAGIVEGRDRVKGTVP